MDFEQELIDKLSVLVGNALAFFRKEGKILCIVIEYRDEVKYFETFLIKGNRIISKEKMDRGDFKLCDFLEESIFYISKEFKELSEKNNGEFPSEIKVLCNVETEYFYTRYNYGTSFTGEEVTEALKKVLIEKYNINTVKLTKIIKEYKEKTKKECYAIDVIEDEIPNILDDKIGGNPYLPIGVEWPEGMNLLLQVNLKNIELEHFPQKGILEVFVSADCDSPCDIKIFIFDEGLEYQTEFPEQDLEGFFVGKPLKIVLKKTTEHMPINNEGANKLFCDLIKKYLNLDIDSVFDIEDYDEIIQDEEDAKAFRNIDIGITKANIGGYPAYTQDNSELFDLNTDICIFKLDSYLDENIYIGDSGILTITMPIKDLETQDFSNVFGYWDCL